MNTSAFFFVFFPLPQEYLISINECCCLVRIGLLLAFQVDHLSFQ